MARVAHQLQVVQEKVGPVRDGEQRARRRIPARFDGRVDAALPAPLQQRLQKHRLVERLTPRHRDAPARLVVEHGVALDVAHEAVDTDGAPHDFTRARRAHHRALAADLAAVAVHAVPAGGDRDVVGAHAPACNYRTVDARGVAGAAVQAPLAVEHHLRARRLRLGAVTPVAAQRASLEEDDRADAGSVVDRAAIDAGNGASQQQLIPKSLIPDPSSYDPLSSIIQDQGSKDQESKDQGLAISDYTRRNRSAAHSSVSSFFAKQKRTTVGAFERNRNGEVGIDATPCSFVTRIAKSASSSSVMAE